MTEDGSLRQVAPTVQGALWMRNPGLETPTRGEVPTSWRGGSICKLALPMGYAEVAATSSQRAGHSGALSTSLPLEQDWEAPECCHHTREFYSALNKSVSIQESLSSVTLMLCHFLELAKKQVMQGSQLFCGPQGLTAFYTQIGPVGKCQCQ